MTLYAPVRRGGPEHLTFQRAPDGWGDWPRTLRLTRREWDTTLDADYSPLDRKLLCWTSFTLVREGVWLSPLGTSRRSGRYADTYEIRLAWSGSSVIFGPYYSDAFSGTSRAREKALDYLTSRGLVELIDTCAESEAKGE